MYRVIRLYTTLKKWLFIVDPRASRSQKIMYLVNHLAIAQRIQGGSPRAAAASSSLSNTTLLSLSIIYCGRGLPDNYLLLKVPFEKKRKCLPRLIARLNKQAPFLREVTFLKQINTRRDSTLHPCRRARPWCDSPNNRPMISAVGAGGGKAGSFYKQASLKSHCHSQGRGEDHGWTCRRGKVFKDSSTIRFDVGSEKQLIETKASNSSWPISGSHLKVNIWYRKVNIWYHSIV